MSNPDINRAQSILERVKLIAWSDDKTYHGCGNTGYSDVTSAVTWLHDACNSPNKDLSDATSKMICLWDESQSAYANLVAGLDERVSIQRLDTLDGLDLLQNFINVINDDGEYGLDCAGTVSTLRRHHYCPEGTKMVRPAGLAIILQQLRTSIFEHLSAHSPS